MERLTRDGEEQSHFVDVDTSNRAETSGNSSAPQSGKMIPHLAANPPTRFPMSFPSLWNSVPVRTARLNFAR